MSTLKITDAAARKMELIEDLALSTIKDVLEGIKGGDSDEAKVAVKMMGVVAKNRQTMTNRSAIEFGMATSIADETQLRKYVKATNPQIHKALGSGKDTN